MNINYKKLTFSNKKLKISKTEPIGEKPQNGQYIV